MSQPPINNIRIGAMSAAIWANQGAEDKPFYTCTITRAYTDHDGKWHESSSFGRADLLAVAKLADQAHSHIEGLVQADRQEAAQAGAKSAEGAGEPASKAGTTAKRTKARARQR